MSSKKVRLDQVTVKMSLTS